MKLKFLSMLVVGFLLSLNLFGSELSDVPENVIAEFEASFIYNDDAQLSGAEIEMLRPYLSSDEIIDLFASYAGVSKVNIFEGYKPKRRGTACKANASWICTLRGDLPGPN